MKPVLIACENSQQITKRLVQKGIDAYSCDILPCNGPFPERHIQDDVRKVLYPCIWSAVIGRPPCTFLTSANTYLKRGCSKYTPEEAIILREQAIDFLWRL